MLNPAILHFFKSEGL